MRTILIPTDFSTNAHHATDYTIGLFNNEHPKYVLMHAYQEPQASSGMLISIKDILYNDSVTNLENDITLLKKQHPEVENLSFSAVYGDLESAVKNVANTWNIDIVAMGTKGAHGIQKLFSSSNTSNIVNSNKFPLLAVPEEAKTDAPKRIAFATDLSDFSEGAQQSFAMLEQLCKTHNAELHLFNINETKRQLTENQSKVKLDIQNRFANIKSIFHTVYGNDFTTSVNQFVKDNSIDLLVMTARKHNFFERLLKASATKEMIMLSTIPLLVFPESYVS